MTNGEDGRDGSGSDPASDGAGDDPDADERRGAVDGGEVVADSGADPGAGEDGDPETDADRDSGADVANADAADADAADVDADIEDTDAVDADAVDTDADDSLDDADIEALAREDWRAALAAAGELRPPVVKEIIDTHGDRGRRAIEAVSEGRVKRYRDFTVVVGHRAEHIVEDGGCDCQDAAYNLDPADPDERCWHALAVDVATRVGRVDVHDMWYSEVHEFL